MALVYEQADRTITTPGAVPTMMVYPDIGWAMMRSSWEKDATLLAVKSGFAWNHAHADAGSFLLFLTNLAGIVLVGAIVFLLLGFRPTRAERGVEARRGLLLATIGVILLLVPLGLRTVGVVQKEKVESDFIELLAELAEGEYEIERLRVIRRQGELVVEARIVASDKVTPEGVKRFREKLQKKHNTPIRIRATVVPATFAEVGAGDPSIEGATAD